MVVSVNHIRVVHFFILTQLVYIAITLCFLVYAVEALQTVGSYFFFFNGNIFI